MKKCKVVAIQLDKGLIMLKNAKGFSLVEGLVAVGLMAVVGLGMASLMTSMSKNQKGIRDTSEVQNTVNEIQMLLSNSSKSCKDAFLPMPTKTFPFVLDEIKWPTGSSIVKKDTDVKNAIGLRVAKLSLKNGISQPPSNRRDTAGVLHTYDVYKADIILDFNKTNPGNSTGPSAISRSMPIILLYDPVTSALVDCYVQDSHDHECADYFGGTYTGTAPPKCHIPLVVSENSYSINTGGSGGGMGTTRLFIENGGKVGIGTLIPSVALDVAGDFKATNMTASQAINGRNITATQALKGQDVTATEAVMGRNVTATQVVSGQNVTATQTVSGANITASQNITATSGDIGGCTLSGGAIRCPNTISAGGTGTVTLPSTGPGTPGPGSCGVVACPAGQLMTGMNNCTPICAPSSAALGCHIVSNEGPPPQYISTAQCASDEYVLNGGGYCAMVGFGAPGDSGTMHTNLPDGNNGWSVDCYDMAHNNDVPSRAVVTCCKK